MPALRKPHRVAFLVPELTIEGADASFANEAGLLLWAACIEACQRHPGLAVYDAEATPLIPQDGHFVPQHARPGATPSDSFYARSRRDELLWLQLALPTLGVVRLHALARNGTDETFDAAGAGERDVGELIHEVIARWLGARGLDALPRRFPPADAGMLVAAVRMIAPVLCERARAPMPSEDPGWAMATAGGASDRSTAGGAPTGNADAQDDDCDGVTAGGLAGAAAAAAEDAGTARSPLTLAASRRLARTLGGRLGSTLKVPALRLLSLALREDLSDLIVAADPDQPQALFERFRATTAQGRDYALLRRIIAIAPGWARPYGELIDGSSVDPAVPDPVPPSALEAVAGAGLAATCRPDQLDVIEAAANRLDEVGRVDEGVRLLERAVALHAGSPAPQIALVDLHRRADRPGAWLAQAQRSAAQHGCSPDPRRPSYPDQIQVDLQLSDALIRVGRLDEAIALRANRLAGRETSWPRHTRILTKWRKDARFVARAYAREGSLRGDPARVLEGYGQAPPDDAVDVAMLLDALVAMGREREVAHAWQQLGIAKRLTRPVARLAAAHGLLSAGEWRRGVEELWRVELTQPARDDQVAVVRCGRLLVGAPLAVLEIAIGERVVIGAHMLARRMARDIADFAPGAGTSSIVMRALGKPSPIAFDPAWLAGFARDTLSRRAIDALFADHAGAATANVLPSDPGDALARADRLVNHWLEVVFIEAGDDDPRALAGAAAYTAAQALVRYLAATTAPPSPLAGGYRTVAAEALALVRRHRGSLDDHAARAMLGALDPVLRRVDRWIGNAWLDTVERSCAIDERANGDIARFARDHTIAAARILGPEETAVLGTSVARLCRDRPAGWATAVIAQAVRLASHTGTVGAVELADAVAAQVADGAIDTGEAIDLLQVACYLADGISTRPRDHAVRILLASGRADTADAVQNAVDPVVDPDLAADLEPTQHRAIPVARTAPASPAPQPAPPRTAPSLPRDPLFQLLEVGDFAAASARLGDPSWRVRRSALTAARHRSFAENAVDVTARARAAAASVLAESAGLVDHDAMLARAAALAIREQAWFPRDPVPLLGDQITRAAFRARIGAAAPDERPSPPFADRIIVPGGRIERISDYVALLRDLAELAPHDALAPFELDHAAYLELAAAWGAAIDADPTIAQAIAAGLARR